MAVPDWRLDTVSLKGHFQSWVNERWRSPSRSTGTTSPRGLCAKGGVARACAAGGAAGPEGDGGDGRRRTLRAEGERGAWRERPLVTAARARGSRGP